MREIQILKDINYNKAGAGTAADYSDVNDLDEGAVVFLKADGSLLDVTDAPTAAADAATTPFLTLVVGGLDGAKISMNIPTDKSKVRGVLTDYVAPVAEVHHLDDVSANSSSLVQALGLDAGIKIYDYTTTTYPQPIPEYITVPVTAADTEVEDVIDKIIAVGSDLCTLTKSGTGHAAKLVVTAPINSNVKVVPAGAFADNIYITSALITPGVLSQGAGTDILKMEKEFAVERGYTNRVHQESDNWKYAFVADTSIAYDVAVLEWNTIHADPISSKTAVTHSLVIALPETVAATGVAKLLVVLDGVYGVS